MELSTLSPAKGSRKKARRVGRGEGSKGKTCGRGGKGQTARSGGNIPARFEGGQMPLYRRIPKIGFRSKLKAAGANTYNLVSLDTLERFESGATVDETSLKAKGYGTSPRNEAGVKVLGTGKLTKKLTVKVNAISASARAAVEAAGGTVELIK